MKSNVCNVILMMLMLLVVTVLGLSKVLIHEDQVLAFNDGTIETALSPAYRYPGALFRCWDNQFFFGTPAGTVPLTSWSLTETLLGPEGHRRSGALLAIWFTGMAMYWTCRQFKRSRSASFLASILLTLCGWTFTFPVVGLAGRSFTLAWSALSLGMLERGRHRSSWLAYAVAGGFLGLAVSDTPDVGILFAVCCAAYYALTHFLVKDGRRLARSVLLLCVYIAASLFIGYHVVSNTFSTQVAGVSQGTSKNPEQRYAWATQWSLPVEETWSLFANDYHGVSSRSPTKPYWGRMGRSQGWETTKKGFRNFRLAGYAVGIVSLLVVLLLYTHLVARDRLEFLNPKDRWRAWIFLILASLSLMLSWGHHFPLYRAFYVLPYMDTIRNPDKWLGPFTLFFGLAFALGIDLLLTLRSQGDKDQKAKMMGIAWLPAALLALFGISSLLNLVMGKSSFLNNLTDQGYGELANPAWHQALVSNLLFLLILTLTLGVLWFLLMRAKSPFHNFVVIGVLGIAITFELLRAAVPFVEGHKFRHILEPNALLDTLNAQRGQGRIKLIPENHPLLQNWRMSYLLAHGYDLFDPVSVSRMPDDYQRMFTAAEGNVTRFWQMGSIRYFLCLSKVIPELQKLNSPAGEFVLLDSFGVVQSQGAYLPSKSVPPDQRIIGLVEFTGAPPLVRFAPAWKAFPDSPEGDEQVLAFFGSKDFDPVTMVPVQGLNAGGHSTGGTVDLIDDEPAESTLRVTTDTGGLLVRAVKYHPDWNVTIDGEPVALHRAYTLLQAVEVPPGTHEVVFQYAPSLVPLGFSIFGRVALILGTVVTLRKPRKPKD